MSEHLNEIEEIEVTIETTDGSLSGTIFPLIPGNIDLIQSQVTETLRIGGEGPPGPPGPQGIQGVPGAFGVSTLDGLDDVDASAPADGQVLTYSSSSPTSWVALDPGHIVEVNDLSASVTWADVPDANITSSSVTQHETDINHDTLLNYVADEHIDWTADQTIGSPDKKIHSSNIDFPANIDHDEVTLTSLDSPSPSYLTLVGQELTANQIDLGTDVTGVLDSSNVPALDDSNVTSTSVTQHQGLIDHDALLNFEANEHIDWTTDQSVASPTPLSIPFSNISGAATTAQGSTADTALQPGDVTLTSASSPAPGFLTLSGEEFTVDQIDLTTDVTGQLPEANVGTLTSSKISNFDATVSANADVVAATGASHAEVTLDAGSPALDYLTLSGQEITLSQIDLATDVTGTSDNITEGSTNLFLTSAEQTKLGHISVTQAVDLDTMESDIATNNAKVSNVTTNLSIGTQDGTTLEVVSSDGTNVTLPQSIASGNAGLLSGADKDKLDNIAAGAEVNVNADWNSVSSDSQILNKPTLGTAAAADTGDFATAAQGATADTALQPGDITLDGGSPALDYLTIDGNQVISLGLIDLGTDVSGQLPIADVSVEGTPDGTKFLRDDGAWAGVPGGISTLDGLDDVEASAPADGQVLTYSSSSPTGWVASDPGHITEVNDLTASVTWGSIEVPNANITSSSVTQHEALINHDALLNYVADEHIDWTVDQTIGSPDLTIHPNNISGYATSVQGDLANTALQPGDITLVTTVSPSFISLSDQELIVGLVDPLVDIDITGTPDDTKFLRGDGSWATPVDIDHDEVTLVTTTSPSFISLSDQELTVGLVDLATDVTGTLSVDNGGTGATTVLGSQQALDLEPGVDVQAHSTILDNTTASFTTADEAKVDYLTVTAATDLDEIRNRVIELDQAVILQGTWDPNSASPASFPQGVSSPIDAGYTWIITGDATVDGVSFHTDDKVIALVDSPDPTSADDWHVSEYRDDVISVAGLNGIISAADLRTAINVADGAEVNVNADWNSVSGDSQILNKPTLGTAAAADTGDFATSTQGTTADSALQPGDITLTTTSSPLDYLTLSGETFTLNQVNLATDIIGTTDDIIEGANKFVTAGDITNLGNLSGTNTGDVTLVTTNSPSFISLSGQELTVGLVDLATDVTGLLPIAEVSIGGSVTGSNFLGDDGTWQSIPEAFTLVTTNSPSFVSLSGQELTVGLVDLATDVTGILDASNIGTHSHAASDISDFDTEVGNNTDVAANTAARHAATTLTTTASPLDYLTLDEGTQAFTLNQVDLSTDVTGQLPVDDVAIGGIPNGNKFLRDDGTWASVPVGISTLDGLDDVDASAPSDGQVLTYSVSSPNGWIAAPSAVPSGVGGTEQGTDGTTYNIRARIGDSAYYLQDDDGDPRGEYSVDLQTNRNNSDEVANAQRSTLTGGYGNKIGTNALASTISGGHGNTIAESPVGFEDGKGGVISGGYQNTLETGYYNAIAGGWFNEILGAGGGNFIGSGYGNEISLGAGDSVIVGGYENIIEAGYGVVGGGYRNHIMTTGSASCTISGGYDNQILFGGNSVISGGTLHEINANVSTIGGGSSNTVNGNYGTIGGGQLNIAGLVLGDQYNTIAGGFTNKINAGSQNTIAGGYTNKIDAGSSNTISGGWFNEIDNTATGSYNTISGGESNVISGGNSSSSAIIGGTNCNITNSTVSIAGGYYADTNGFNDVFIWADSSGGVAVPFLANASNTVQFRASGGLRLVDGNQTNGYVLTCDATGVGTWQPAGGHVEVTLEGGSPGLDYLTLTDQEISLEYIDLTTDVTGLLPIAEVSIGGTPDGTKFLKDDGTWATPVDIDHAEVTLVTTNSPSFITLSDQELTVGLVDLATDVTGLLPIADISIGGTPDGAKFLRDDGIWAGVPGGISTLDGLDDVEASAPSDGQVLTYSVSSPNGWIASDPGHITEVNDLSASVTWGSIEVPNANITSSSVTQHSTSLEGVLNHDNLIGFNADEHIDWTTDQTIGSPDKKIHSSNIDFPDDINHDEVTLVTTTSPSFITLSDQELTVGLVDLATDVIWTTVPNAYVSSSSVTQHEALINHDALLNYVADEHIDWTTDQTIGSPDKKIHSSNIDFPDDINHDEVTLEPGSPALDYLTIAGQVITLNEIDLATDVTGILDASNLPGDLGATTLNELTDVNATATDGQVLTYSESSPSGWIASDTAEVHDAVTLTSTQSPALSYITLSGSPSEQELVLDLIDLSIDVTGLLSLTNVNISGTPDGAKFLRDDGIWAGVPGGISTLDGLDDVEASAPTDGQVLTYSSSSPTGWVSTDPGHIVEVNDLSSVVTWADVPDANITSSSVTQHEALINHDALLNYVADEHIDWTVDQTAGSPDKKIHSSNINFPDDIDHDEVTLVTTNSPSFVSLSGQELTVGLVDLTTDVTGLLPIAEVSIGGTPDGTKFLKDDGTWETPGAGHDSVTLEGGSPGLDYLTLDNQVINLGQIDLSTDVTGTLPVDDLGAGSNGQVLTVTGGVATWETPGAGHDSVTLEGGSPALDYLTLDNQVINLGQIDLSTDVTGTLDAASVSNNSDVIANTAARHDEVTLQPGSPALDYLTLSGQEITLSQVDLATDVTGTSDSITEGSTNLFLTSAERTKLSNTTNTNSGDVTLVSAANPDLDYITLDGQELDLGYIDLSTDVEGQLPIADVSIGGTPDGAKFLRDDGIWAGVPGGISTLDGLDDVDASAPTDGQVLTYSSSSPTGWVASDAAAPASVSSSPWFY